MSDQVNSPLLFCASWSNSITSLSACFNLSSKAWSVTVSSPVPRFAIRFSNSRNLSRCSATYARGTEAQLRHRAKHLQHHCFQQASASHRRKSRCTSGHVPPSPVVPTVAFVALPYLSLICNRPDTLGSLAKSGCRNSFLHTGHSGSPQSLPCTHSDRSPGTAGSANPQDHSHRLRGS